MTPSSQNPPPPITVGDGLALTVLGCDGSFAGPGGACSGYLVSTSRERVLLDAGPGTLARLQRHVGLTDLTAVVVSHEHPDHCLELPVLRNALKYVLETSGLRVITTRGTRELVDHVCNRATPTFVWDVVADGAERRIGDLRLRFTATDHPVETLGVRIDHPAGSIAYTADTGGGFDGAALDPDGTGVDVLVVECSMGPGMEGRVQHLSAAQAARVAERAGARQVVATHVVPGDDPERRRKELVAELAARGLQVPVLLASSRQTWG